MLVSYCATLKLLNHTHTHHHHLAAELSTYRRKRRKKLNKHHVSRIYKDGKCFFFYHKKRLNTRREPDPHFLFANYETVFAAAQRESRCSEKATQSSHGYDLHHRLTVPRLKLYPLCLSAAADTSGATTGRRHHTFRLTVLLTTCKGKGEGGGEQNYPKGQEASFAKQ